MDVSAFESLFALNYELRRDLLNGSPEARREFSERALALKARAHKARAKAGTDTRNVAANILERAAMPLPPLVE